MHTPTNRLTRGTFGATLGNLALPAPAIISRSARAAGDDLPVASIFDLTGNVDIYGVKCMQASRYAVSAINAEGGVLGRQLVLRECDGQCA